MRALHFIYNGFSEYEVALACSLLASKGEVLTASLTEGAEFLDKSVVTDMNLVTAKGFATVEFALAIGDKLRLFCDGERANFESFWTNRSAPRKS